MNKELLDIRWDIEKKFSFINYLKITNGAVVLSHTVEVKKKLDEKDFWRANLFKDKSRI